MSSILKKIFILVLLILFIYDVDAKSVFNYSTAKALSVKYSELYTDNDLYLVRGKNIPFGYKDSTVYVDTNFDKSGLLNAEEYHSSGGTNSYLFDGSSTLTMTIGDDGNSVLAITDIGSVTEANTDEEFGAKTTHFVQQDVRVSGDGSFSNPFVFIEKTRSFTNNYEYTGKNQTYFVQYDGNYEFTVNGAQGKNGGKGGQVKTSLKLYAGDEVTITVGGQTGKFGGGTGKDNGGDSSRIYVNGILVIAAGGGGGGSTSSVGGTTSSSASVGGSDVGSGSGSNGQMYSGGGSSAGYSGSSVSACKRYNGTSYCTSNRQLEACGYTSTFNKSIKTCNGSTTGYTRKYKTCQRRLASYTKVTRKCRDGFEVHKYTCSKAPWMYENVNHKCNGSIGSYSYTKQTCVSKVTGYTKRTQKCVSKISNYSKTTKKCVKSGIFYKWSSSTTTSSSCSKGSSFTCNKSNVNKSYVSGCTANRSNSWSYTDSSVSSCSVGSSFSCTSSTAGRTYVSGCTPKITNSWSSSSGTSGSCTTGGSFSCTSSRAGNSYYSACTPKWNFSWSAARNTSTTNGASGSAFTCNQNNIGKSYTTSTIQSYKYTRGEIITQTKATSCPYSGVGAVECTSSNYDNFQSGSYGSCLATPFLITETTTASSCAVDSSVSESGFCGRSNGSTRSYVQSCTPNYTYYLGSTESTDSSASSCSVSSSQSCNTSGTQITTSCSKNNSYYFTDSSQNGLSSCSTTGSFTCNSSTKGSSYVNGCTEIKHFNTCCAACNINGNSGQGGKNYLKSGTNASPVPSGFKTGNGNVIMSFNGEVDS